MSKEGPKAPLWPEVISKVRLVENHKLKALTEGVAVPVANQPDLSKPGEQSGENPVLNHVQELQRHAEPVYPKERVDEAREKWPDESLDMVIWRLKDEDQRKEDKKHGRRRGFSCDS
jgi:hypothetical protein